jgi:hypothetical protein
MGYNLSIYGTLELSGKPSKEAIEVLDQWRDAKSPIKELSYPLNFQFDDDGNLEALDDSDRNYDFDMMLVAFVETFLLPEGITVEGEIQWDGEESGDQGYCGFKVVDGVQTTYLRRPPDERDWPCNPIIELSPKAGKMISMPARYEDTPWSSARITPDQVWRTHQWIVVGDEEGASCGTCDSKAGSVSAGWPCGSDIPRVRVLL